MPKPNLHGSNECSAASVPPSPKTRSISVPAQPCTSSARATTSNAVRGRAVSTPGNGRSIGGKAMKTRG